jgi:hypothetical protein
MEGQSPGQARGHGPATCSELRRFRLRSSRAGFSAFKLGALRHSCHMSRNGPHPRTASTAFGMAAGARQGSPARGRGGPASVYRQADRSRPGSRTGQRNAAKCRQLPLQTHRLGDLTLHPAPRLRNAPSLEHDLIRLTGSCSGSSLVMQSAIHALSDDSASSDRAPKREPRLGGGARTLSLNSARGHGATRR